MKVVSALYWQGRKGQFEMDDDEELIYDLPRGSEALSEDVTSETGSVCEEERVRKLFQACDADGDGYIDRYTIL